MCRRETGEKEKENARGTMGRGKREKRPFFLPIISRRAFYISITVLLFLLGYTAGASAEERALTWSPSYRDSTERSKGKQGLNLGVRFSEVSVLYGGVC